MIRFENVFVATVIVLMLTAAAFPPAFFLHGVLPIWRGTNELVLGFVTFCVIATWGLTLVYNWGGNTHLL